jgi:TatD DNase family protein
MDLKFFDAHCHVQLSQFDIDREEVLTRMEEGRFGGIVVGVDFATSREALELAYSHDFLWAAIGLHPHDNVAEEFDMTIYRELAADPKVVAIGECGLDYFRSGETEEERDAQKHRFESQIALAVEVGKPLIIHCRDAHEDMLAILKKHMGAHPELKVIIHFFTGTGELAQKYLDLGCYLSFPGPITYTNSYDESIRVAPLDKILSETDSPFAAPMPFRGKRNEPIFVEEVVKKIAAIKGVSVDVMAAPIGENFKKVFRV